MKGKKESKRNKVRPYRLSKPIWYRRSPLFQNINYPVNAGPSTFGPGVYHLKVTKLFTGRLDVQQEINLFNDILATNAELGRVSPDFKYVICEGIAVTFPARNLSVEGNMTPAYLMVNYDGSVTQNIRLQDNVKMIPPFLNRDKVFKFKLPSINVYGGILNKWFALDNIAYSYANVVFQLYSPNNTTNWYVRFDAIMTFRGPTNVTAKAQGEFKGVNNKEGKEVEEKENKNIKEDEQADVLKSKVVPGVNLGKSKNLPAVRLSKSHVLI